MSTKTSAPVGTGDRTQFIETVGEIIAASRYKRWDSHAPNIPWQEYVDQDPTVAEGIYLADGRADAEALMPFLNLVFDKARSFAFAAAAAAAEQHPEDAVAVLTAAAAEFDPIANGSFDAVYPDTDED